MELVEEAKKMLKTVLWSLLVALFNSAVETEARTEGLVNVDIQ